MTRLFFLFTLCFSLISVAQNSLRFEVLSGPVHNFPSKLSIHQHGYGSWTQTARYRSEPFKLPPYYDFRLTWWMKNKIGIGGKFTHHKLILDNPQGPIQFFEITHGYNILSATLIRSFKYINCNAAVGMVVAHPQSTIHDIRYRRPGFWQGGYVISGVVGEVAISKSVTIWDNLYATAEVRATTAWARVPVAHGYADAPNTALHGLVGLGYKLWNK